MSLPRYPDYKESGVQWLGLVPAHWRVDRFKASIVSSRNGIWGDEPQGDENDIACVRVADFDRVRSLVKEEIPTVRSVTEKERAGRLLRQGDLLLEKSGGGELQPVGRVVMYQLSSPAVCSNFVARVELRDEMVSGFWNYAHGAAYSVGVNVGSINQTSGIQNLAQDRYFDERAPFPPKEDQSKIAAFLDRETAKIDALIADQEKLLALLAEKRQATISHAVTRGLNPDVPMKDSDVSWLGKVPAHWEVLQLRRLVLGFEQGWSPECESRQTDGEEWGVLKAGCVNGGVFNPNEHKALPAHLEPRLGLEVRDGDLLMSRASGSTQLIGSVARLVNPPPRLMLSDKIFRLQLSSRVSADFFAFAMASMPLRSQIEQAIGGAQGLANNLPQASIKEFWLAVPSFSEQLDVVKYLAVEEEKIASLAKNAQRSAALLKERRSALIAAAVTGKIDVRGLVDDKEAA